MVYDCILTQHNVTKHRPNSMKKQSQESLYLAIAILEKLRSSATSTLSLALHAHDEVVWRIRKSPPGHEMATIMRQSDF